MRVPRTCSRPRWWLAGVGSKANTTGRTAPCRVFGPGAAIGSGFGFKTIDFWSTLAADVPTNE